MTTLVAVLHSLLRLATACVEVGGTVCRVDSVCFDTTGAPTTGAPCLCDTSCADQSRIDDLADGLNQAYAQFMEQDLR